MWVSEWPRLVAPLVGALQPGDLAEPGCHRDLVQGVLAVARGAPVPAGHAVDVEHRFRFRLPFTRPPLWSCNDMQISLGPVGFTDAALAKGLYEKK